MSAFSRAPFSGEAQHTEAGTEVPVVTVKGTVVSIEGGIASVLVGPEREAWDFPLEILPDTVAVESVLVLERNGRRLRFVELDPVSEMARGRPFDLRLRRTARKVPYMRTAGDPHLEARRAQ